MAAFFGHLEVIQFLVQDFGADVNLEDEDCCTPLYIASQKGHVAIVRCLVKDLGADVTQRPKNGFTPLHIAARMGHLDTLRCLVDEFGAVVNEVTEDGSTSLMIAAQNSRHSIVRYLLKHVYPFCFVNHVTFSLTHKLLLTLSLTLLGAENEIRALVNGRGVKPIIEYSTPPSILIPFIDRDAELSSAWQTLLSSRNLRRDPTQKLILLATRQMSGSGKTTFAANLFNFGDSRVEKLLVETASEEDQRTRRSVFTVRIDLQEHQVDELPQKLGPLLSLLVWRCALMRYKGVTQKEVDDLWLQHRPTDLYSCVTILKAALDCSLFLHFDEVSTIEDAGWTPLVGGDDQQSVVGGDYKQSPLRRYYSFWAALVPLLRHDSAFLYLTGRTTAFSMVGRGRLGAGQSPSRVSPLFLSCFKPGDIKHLLRSSKMADGQPIAERLRWIDVGEKQDDFVHELHLLTAGMPRLLQNALEHMINRGLVVSDMDSAEKMDTVLTPAVLCAPGASLDIAAHTGTARRARS
jgi:ankyrin repeat protein